MHVVAINPLKAKAGDRLKKVASIVTSPDTADYHQGLSLPDADAYIQPGNIKLGYNESVRKVFYAARNTGKPVMVTDVSIFRDVEGDPDASCRMSWDCFGTVKGRQPYDPSYDRWGEKYNLPIHDWQRRGDEIVVGLQKHNDGSLHELHEAGINYNMFMAVKIKDLLSLGRPVTIRPHPRAKGQLEYFKGLFGDKVKYSTSGTIREALDSAWCYVTYNSTSCVEASLYGVPVYALNHAAATYSIAHHSIDQLETLPDYDTLEWCKRAAFWQWTWEEIANHGDYIWHLYKQVCIK